MESFKVVRTEETYKRLIQTVIDKTPSYIDKYSSNDRILLNEFIDVLRYFNEADFARNNLLTRFEEYRTKARGHPKLLRLPFLWFTHDYITMALRLLSISDFHSLHFYSYLDKQLRGSSAKIGVFPFIKNKILLTDQNWEVLQIQCNKLRFALTDDQLQNLKDVHFLLSREGIYSLNQKAIINSVKQYFNKSRLFREISNFFTLLDARWFIRAHFPGYGLSQFFFQIELKNSVNLNKVVSLSENENTVLRISNVYQNKFQQNSYLGLLVVPVSAKEKLKQYFNNCEQEGLIVQQNLEEITNSRSSASFLNYTPKQGWVNIRSLRWKHIAIQLQREELQENRNEIIHDFFVTPPFNSDWSYKQHKKPSEVIAFLCRCPYEVVFKQLPWNIKKDQSSLVFSQKDKAFLKQLHKHQILHTGLISNTLFNEFSLTPYWIKAPLIDFQLLKIFLAEMTYCQVFVSKNNYYIWTQLPKTHVERISNDLKWKVIPSIEVIPTKSLHFTWYDIDKKDWITPQFLSDF